MYYNRLEFTSSSCVFNEKEKKHLRSGRCGLSDVAKMKQDQSITISRGCSGKY